MDYYTTNPPSAYLSFFRRLTFMEDISISNPTNGQVLAYNSTTGRWANSAGGGGGGGGGDNIGTGTALIRTTATTGFGGTPADQEANGGIVLNKNFVNRDGTVNKSYSQALIFGDPTVNGSWRMVAIQDTNNTENTVLSLEVLNGGNWIQVNSWDRRGLI